MDELLQRLGLSGVQEGAVTGCDTLPCHGSILEVVSPVNGRVLGSIRQASEGDYEQVAVRATEAFLHWRKVPAPRRGEVVRQIGQVVRERKRDLAELITMEMGKILPEAEGEVQEMIDIADFSVGLSRTLCGLTMHSERPGHRMYEQWHPLGPIGVITAFNFPLAVWSWNAMIAMAAGDTVIWKPSSKTPLTALAIMNIVAGVLRANGLPEGILNVVIGERNVLGERLIGDRRLPLISATGSVAMGRHVARAVAARLGRSLLELGGNNGVIVAPSADLDLTIRAILFGAVGTAGQRCTTIRRAIVHKDVYHALCERLVHAYRQVVIGNPLQEKVLMGPLIDREAVVKMMEALTTLRKQGGRVLYGGEVLEKGLLNDLWPALTLLLSLAFFLQNQEQEVTLRYFFGLLESSTPIYKPILTAFAVGLLVSGILLFPPWVRGRIELRRKTKALQDAEVDLERARQSLEKLTGRSSSTAGPARDLIDE
ncbi:MAG: aldehyde dehydrogenase family protein [Syntrophobacteraceae bacterium]|nr:aldehyde dehydrogenase family protein [Syntrophobacteraceae bacterium]